MESNIDRDRCRILRTAVLAWDVHICRLHVEPVRETVFLVDVETWEVSRDHVVDGTDT